MSVVGRAIFFQGGRITQVGDTDQLQVGIIDSTVAGAITIGGTLATSILAAKRLNVDAGLDVSSAVPLNIGGTSASRIDLGSAGNLAKVWIHGDLDVQGVESFHGIATFSSNALFNGNVTFGDGTLPPGSDTVSFDAATRIITDMTFGEGATRTISIGQSTTGNGNILQLRGGAPLAAGGNGGALNLIGAAGLVNGNGGNVNITAGDTAGIPSTGTAGDVVLSPGQHPSGTGPTYGRILWGHVSDNSPTLLVNSYVGTQDVGFRSSGGVMQFRNLSGPWQNIGAAGSGTVVDPGTAQNQHLYWETSGTPKWTWENDLTLPAGVRTITIAKPTGIGGGYVLNVYGGDSNGANQSGGDAHLVGGMPNTPGGSGTGSGGSAYLEGNGSDLGRGGSAWVKGGDQNAGALVRPGDVILSPGYRATTTVFGQTFWGHNYDQSPYLVTQYDGYGSGGPDTGVGFRIASGIVQFRNRSGAWQDIGSATGTVPSAVAQYQHLEAGAGPGYTWGVVYDLTLPGNASRTISVAPPAALGAGNNLTVSASAATTTGTGGNLLLNAGAGTGVNQIGGAVTITGGAGTGSGAGGSAFLVGAAAVGTGIPGAAQVKGGASTISAVKGGEARLLGGDSTIALADGGDVIIHGGTAGAGGVSGLAAIYGNVKFGSPSNLAANIDFSPVVSGSRVISDIAFKNDADYQIYIAGTTVGRSLTIHPSDGIAAGNPGGGVTVRSGNGLTTGAGGLLTLAGGSSTGLGAGGSVRISGGTSGAGVTGSVYLAYTTGTDLFFGQGTNGLHYAGNVLSAIGLGSISLPNATAGSTVFFQIGGVPVTSAAITAANFDTLFNGGDASALHTHAGLAGSSVDVPVLAGTAVAGQASYVSATGTSIPATAGGTAIASRALGVNQTATSVRIQGVATVSIEGVLVVTPGDELYLSATAAGKVTNVPPFTVGQFITYLGIAKTGATGPATCDIYLNPDRPLAL